MKTAQNESTVARVLSAIMVYFKPKFLVIGLLGFSSGLPLLLTSSVLAYWLRKMGVSIETIGLLSVVAVPYSLKFLWSPLLDKTHLPFLATWLGQRRAMALLVQLLLILSILGLGLAGLTHPENHIIWVVVAASAVAFFSASQDMMIDGIRVEMLKDKEQAAGAAMATAGYRVAMLLVGAGVLLLADTLPADDYLWFKIFGIAAMFQILGMIAVLLAPKLGDRPRHKTYTSVVGGIGGYFTTHFWHPLKDFFVRQPQAITLLLFLVFYKYGDAFMGIMANPFYLDMGFTGIEIAKVVKSFGLLMTLAGGFIGGMIVFRYGFMTTLWVGGIAQALTNGLFVWLSLAGHDMPLLTLTIVADNFAGGVATIALVGFMGHLVNMKHSVTQLALLTSVSAIGRSMLSAPAGYVAAGLGYPVFFALSIMLAVPGLWLLAQLHFKKNVTGIKEVKGPTKSSGKPAKRAKN